jgi:succinoglycan biosynthesis transport protein ExoP
MTSASKPPADLIDKLRRRRLTVVVSAGLTMCVAAGVFWSLTPRYLAESAIMINEREPRVVSFQAVLSAIPNSADAVESEVQVLQSRDRAGDVVDALHLTDRPEFNSNLSDHRPLTSVKRFVHAQIDWLTGAINAPSTPDTIKAGAVDTLLKKLFVEPVGRSRAIRISIQTEDAALSAAIVNGIVNSYIDSQLQTKLGVTRRANSFLAVQADDMRTQVRNADAAVASYRTDFGLLEGSKEKLLISQEVTDTLAQLDIVRNKRAEAEARVRQSNVATNLPEVVKNETVAHLEQLRADLAARAIEAEATRGRDFSLATQLRMAVKDIDRRITKEMANIAASLGVEAEVQRLHEANLEANVARLKQMLGESYQAEVKMHALQREADVGRGLLQAIMTRQQEVSMGEVLQQADAIVISRANVPLQPAFPRPLLFLAVASFGSIGVGCGVAVALERKSIGFRSMDDISPSLDIKPLGLVPQLPRRVTAPRYVMEQPESAFAESLRAILTSLILPRSEPLVLLIASAVPHEGKSSTAVALGRLAATMGLRTLIIDADLRRPTLHKLIGIAPGGPGLSDVLVGKASAGQVIRQDTGSKLFIVTAGPQTGEAVRLLSSDALRQTIATWRTEFDLIIVDSPPTAAVADARILAQACDAAVFIAHWNRTRRGLVSAEIDRLRSTGIRIAGLMLTHVNIRQHALDQYSDSGAFYEYGRDYYNG